MPQLPAALLLDGVPSTYKLVYLWVKLNPGEHSVRSLEAALGAYTRTALRDLTAWGVLIEETPPAGPRAGTYKAAPQPRGPRPRQSEETEEQHGG